MLAPLLALALIAFHHTGALADPIAAERIRVLDGDTIEVQGQARTIRLVGFNAPETSRAECDAERQLGNLAALRLRQLVAAGDLDLKFIACSCPPGTEGTRACNYGRGCAVLPSNGEDVGSILIREKLAVPFLRENA